MESRTRMLGNDRSKFTFIVLVIACVSVAFFLLAWLERWPLMAPFIVIFRVLKDIASILIVGIPIFSSGYWVCNNVLRVAKDKSPVWVLFFSWAFGCGVMILFGLGMLILGIYHPLIWQSLAFALNLGVLFKLARRHWQPVIGMWRRLFPRGKSLGTILKSMSGWDLIVITILLLAFLEATLPPSTRDELVYHLGIPRLWEYQHHWWMNTDNFHLLFPANIEILWGYALAVSGLHAPALLTLVFSLLTLGVMRVFMAERLVPSWIRGVSLVFFACTPVIMVMIPINYVEWPLLFFVLVGWYSSVRFLKETRRDYALLTALAWGIASGAKYSIVVIVALLSLEWIYSVSRSSWPRAGFVVVLLAAATLLFASPWLVRNFVMTGDPVFPLGENVFPARLALPSAQHPPAASHLTRFESISGPWRFYPMLYHMTADRNADDRLHLGWLFLHLGVLSVGWKYRRDLPWFTTVTATVFFAFFTPSPRIYVPFLALLWLFLPNLLHSTVRSSPGKCLATGTLLLFFVSSFPFGLHYWFMSYNRASQDYLLGFIGDHSYLEKEGLVTPVIDWIQKNAPKESRIWLVGSDRIFYLNRWVRSSDSYEIPAFFSIAESAGEAGLDQEIGKDRIDFIVLDAVNCSLPRKTVRVEDMEFRIPDEALVRANRWMTNRLRLIAKDQRYELYRIRKP